MVEVIQTVYVTIGNSDDKLSQLEWSHFYRDTNEAMFTHSSHQHGAWISPAISAFQNACWCIEIDSSMVYLLMDRLRYIGRQYKQNTIAWAEVPAEAVKFIQMHNEEEV